jgi:hypothetical protein
MKKILLALALICFCYTSNSYAGTIIVCDNVRDGQDRTAVAIDNKKKTINWNNEIVYYVEEGNAYGTGRVGSPMLGDMWGMDKTGTLAIAINRFTYEAKRKNMAKGLERSYLCRKISPNEMLF